MLVNEVMKSNVESCHPDSNLESIALTMWNHDCGAIPVIDDENHPLGIITDRDIAMGSSLNHRSLWDLTAREITKNHPLYSCKADDNIQTVLEIMKEHQVRRVPVTDGEGKLVGMVSLGDIVTIAQKTASAKSGKLSYAQVMDVIKDISKQHTHDLVRVA